MKVMYQCGHCREEGKRGLRPKWTFDEEEVPDKRCPVHQRVLHIVYIDSNGEEHTLDRWDVTVFRAIISDIMRGLSEIHDRIGQVEDRLAAIEALEE